MSTQSPLLQIMRKPPDPAERCDVCGTPIAEEHDHLVNVHARALLCACRACALLFAHEGAGGRRFRAVPRRYVDLGDVSAAQVELESLDLPIGLAFFLRSSLTGRITAFYPGPLGATESELRLDAWEVVTAALPPLTTLAPDVEAALFRRASQRTDALIIPIDGAYELVGRIRSTWRGIAGGDEVWGEIDRFFARAAERARAMAAA